MLVNPNPLIGFILTPAEGYSFRTNQCGLSVDNVLAYNIVLLNGTIATASEEDRDDLFGALKVWPPWNYCD